MRADRLADIDRLLRDATSLVTAEDRDAALTVALNRYGQDRPRALIHRMAVPVGGIPLAELPDWTEGLSALTAVEYPTYPYSPADLPSGCWRIVPLAAGPLAVLADHPAGICVGLRYTGPHVVSDTVDTIPPGHREALACFAAAHLLEGLAAAHAGDRDPVLNAEGAAGLGDVSRSYAARAKRMRELYAEGIAAGAGAGLAAGTSVALSLPASDGGRRIFRRR